MKNDQEIPINDGVLDIAVGRSRKETKWKNTQIQWSALIEKLSATHRTVETYAAYMAATKERQDEIKDVGGIVGGYLVNGKRKNGSVAHRQLVTLDLDFAKPGFWADFRLIYDNAAVLYSTHKHRPEKPRLRLVLPLSREVAADEYVAIARRIAGNVGIEYFDHTTFEPTRLMYWPSTSKDGEYLFEFQNGEWIDADQVLASYRNWKDCSEYPTSEIYTDDILRQIKKQEDPVSKPGLIGAFCRTYSIEEVIEKYLNEEYAVCDIPGRYTYTGGSTSAGLVTYEGKFAFSHHGTDPISGKLCNAWDLVRIHKFGDTDKSAKENTAANRLPSFTAMSAMISQDKDVKRQLGVDRLAEAKEDFTALDNNNGSDGAKGDWYEDLISELDVNSKGIPLSTRSNIMAILQRDERLKDCFAHNIFSQRKILLRDLPWRKVTSESHFFTDEDEAGLRIYLEQHYSISNNKNVEDALKFEMVRKQIHPVRDYLSPLQWDGVARVETLLIDYLGAPDTRYVREVTRKSLTAAVARVFSPGVKFDNVLTLVGPEGIGKSTIIGKLAGEWFSDSLTFSMLSRGNAAQEALQGFWILEIGELVGLRKADVDDAKQFISKREDVFRGAWKKYTGLFPRQCVFWGSTNNQDFLKGATGNRRFWPVPVGILTPTKSVFDDFTGDAVGQIWAEAVQMYGEGEPLHLSVDIEAEAREVQASHTEVDEREGMIQIYLDTLLPENWDNMPLYDRRAWLAANESNGVLGNEAGFGDIENIKPGTVKRTKVSVSEIWCEVLGGKQNELSIANAKVIKNIMRKIQGWKLAEGKMRFRIYGVLTGYIRIETSVANSQKSHENVANLLLQ